MPWLYLSIQQLGHGTEHLRLASTDIHTLWITLVLHRMCGWRFKISPELQQLDLSRWTHLDMVPPHGTATTEVLISLAPQAVWVKATMH